jgi:hypothetical protein
MRDDECMRPKKEREDFEAEETGLGPESGGQSGDLQGLDSDEETGLLEEGQTFEAGVLSGIDRAATADDGGIKTREVPEDDVPLEYLDDEQGNQS